ncbi:MAG: hypothetical protein HY736_06755 [Verrucomicrobia bacterium]|nr:hypothetical protein [Verrucomicrobiota bacterium]
MTDPNKKPGGWSAVRPQLASWDKPALLALVKDLYAASEVGRDLVNARCQPGESGAATLEKYRARIVEQMTVNIGWGFHDYIGDVVAQLYDELGGGDAGAALSPEEK